jgi:hypothetical protein
VEHAPERRLEVGFQILDNPELLHPVGVEIHAMGMIAFGAAPFAPGVGRSQRSGTITANLSSLPHPRCRRPLSAHWRSLGEIAKRRGPLVVEGLEGPRDCGLAV